MWELPFTTGPFDEFRRDRILNRTADSIHARSFTARKQEVDDYAQKAIVLRASGGPDTKVTVSCTRPRKYSLTRSFRELAESNEMLFPRPFPWDSAMLHRLVFAENYETAFSVTDQDAGDGVSWYYVRVFQSNGHLAWSSPIWVEKS